MVNQYTVARFASYAALTALLPLYPIVPSRMAQRFSRSREKRRPGTGNPFFFEEWYRQQHEHSALAQTKPIHHYLLNHQMHGVEPNPFFDSAFYRKKQMTEGDGRSPLEHFWQVGCNNGYIPHPAWRELEYLTCNPEVRGAVQSGNFRSGYHHFCTFGARDVQVGRPLPVTLGRTIAYFGESEYLVAHPHVAGEIALGRVDSGIEHFFRHGYYECAKGRRDLYGAHQEVEKIQFTDCERSKRGRDIVLFAHYDPHGMVDPHVFAFLNSLVENDCDVIFISSGFRPEDEEQLRRFCRFIILKNDVGRDFGSWFLAHEHFGADWFDDYEHLMFVNDSVYWPVRDAAPFFQDMRALDFDLWGAVDTHQLAYHIQSWFLAFNAKARKTLLPRFIEKFRSSSELIKAGQIWEYEVWLTQEALELSLSVGSFCSIDDIREEVIRGPETPLKRQIRCNLFEVNLSHQAWSLLINSYSSPALKVGLLKAPPPEDAELKFWSDRIDSKMAPVIANHQARLAHRTGSKRRLASSQTGRKLELVDRIPGLGLGHGNKLVILAHYDPDDILDPHVIKMIDGLKSVGADVALVSGSLDQSSLELAKTHASEILIKTNTARDFGSWYLGLEHLRSEIAGYDSVVWMNDSVYFPLFDPKEMFEKMAGIDFWGPVDSYNIRWHTMSWFWSFSKATIASGIFDWYQEEYYADYSKWDQIKNYEMRIPLMLRDQGFDCRAYVSADDLMRSRRVKKHSRFFGQNHFTMTHDFWEVIIEDFRCPALKVELVRDNPLDIDLGRNLSKVVEVLERHTDYDPALVLNHIVRVART